MSKTTVEVVPKQEDFTTDDLKPDDKAVLLCMYADYDSPFDDNVVAKCGDGSDGSDPLLQGCGRDIIHRPHVPKGAVKLCHACAMQGIIRAKEQGEDIRVRLTEKTHKEVQDYLDSKPEAANTKPNPWKWS